MTVLLIGVAQAYADQRVSLQEGRVLATELIANNQPAAAREIALGLLQANPRDIDALILLSRAERALGNTKTALDAGKAAWALADTQAKRFVVASVIAQAHSSAANFTRAQFWLRRAEQAAPNDQLSALAARDYGVLRRANPWSFNLTLGAMPTNNVNNGNSNSTLTFAYLPGSLANIAWPVPADSRPLSGLALTGQAQLSYRIAKTQRTQTAVNLAVFAQGYVLSDSAKSSAPDVVAQSLGYQQATVGLSHTWAPEGSSGLYSADLSFTAAFYGGDPYTTDVALTFGRQWQHGEAQVFSASIAGNQTTYRSNGSQTNGLALRGAWQRTLANADVIGLSLNASEVHSPLADRGYAALGAQVSYDFGEVFQGVEVLVSGSLEQRVYDASRYDPAGRQDIRTSLQVNIGLPVISFYGFEPVATVATNTTTSSVPFFETESVRLGLQIKSKF